MESIKSQFEKWKTCTFDANYFIILPWYSCVLVLDTSSLTIFLRCSTISNEIQQKKFSGYCFQSFGISFSLVPSTKGKDSL